MHGGQEGGTSYITFVKLGADVLKTFIEWYAIQTLLCTSL